MMEIKSHRSIVCSSIFSKHHNMSLRSRLVSLFAHFLQDSQCGGVPKKGVDMAKLFLRVLLTRTTAAMNNSYLITFHDVKTSVYAVIRQMLIALPLTTEEYIFDVLEEYLDVLDSVEIPIALVQLLELSISTPARVPENTSDQQLVSILSDAHQDTLFQVPCLPK